MTDYVKTTSFTPKDSLPTGNPAKAIKGVDFDVEFDAIATAVATKANTANPAFTGTPTAPTATAGTSNTQVATTAFVAAAVTASAGIQASGGTMTGLLDLFTTTVKKVALGSSTIDLATGSAFSYTVSGSQTFVFTNTPATSNTETGFVLELTNGGSSTVTWPASVKWPNGTAPVLTASGVDVLVFVTFDNGTTWRAAVAMLKSS